MTKLLNIKAAAELLSISPYTVRSYIRAGKLRSVRIGRRVLLAEAELERLVAESQGRPEVRLETRNGGEPTEEAAQ
jgi:excisionase family DNA binding protein